MDATATISLWRRAGLLVLGALLGVVAFPPLELRAAAWFMPLCWMAAVEGLGMRARFISGAVGGYLFVALAVGWIREIFGLLALLLFLIPAAYYGAWAALGGLSDHMGVVPRIAWPGCVWVATEYARGEILPPNFAWLTLGFTQVSAVGAALAPVVGVYGISFVLVTWGGAVWWLLREARGAGRARLALGALALLPLLSVPDPPRWAGERALGEVELVQLTNGYSMEDVPLPDPSRPSPTLILWPEYTLFRDPHGVEAREAMARLKREAAASRHGLLFGAVDRTSPGLGDREFYNTTYLLSPEGRIEGRASKNRPIPFMRDGKPAPAISLLPIPGIAARRGEGTLQLGVGVCYDASFQRFARRMARQGADVLAFPSFNAAAWGAIQHRQFARIFQMRALENALPVLVAAVSGPTLAIAPDGAASAMPTFHETHRVRAPIAEPTTRRTVFTMGGWYVGPACLIVTLLVPAIRIAQGLSREAPV